MLTLCVPSNNAMPKRDRDNSYIGSLRGEMIAIGDSGPTPMAAKLQRFRIRYPRSRIGENPKDQLRIGKQTT